MPEKNNKMPEFYTIFARKTTFCPNLGGGATAPRLPVSYAYEETATHSTYTPPFVPRKKNYGYQYQCL